MFDKFVKFWFTKTNISLNYKDKFIEISWFNHKRLKKLFESN
jgi:hypothetical protein